MKVVKTNFDDLYIIEPIVRGDQRGFFMESYNYKEMKEAGLGFDFVQDNQSRSKQGVLRGLHFQNNPHAQTKLIRVLAGAVLDIVVDLRVEKSTFKQSMVLELSGTDHKQLLVPKGFAHGFLVLSEFADVLYKTDEYYHPASEGGINFFDPALGLNQLWKGVEITLSEKDKNLPFFNQIEFTF
jgi:dTDP-4-dehydrorhamnose 3,5-epimerase